MKLGAVWDSGNTDLLRRWSLRDEKHLPAAREARPVTCWTIREDQGCSQSGYREDRRRQIIDSTYHSEPYPKTKHESDVHGRRRAWTRTTTQRGGAIFSDGGMVFLRDRVMETSEADQGGAVYCDDCRLYVDDTRVASHTAGAGGAFYSDRGTVIIRNGNAGQVSVVGQGEISSNLASGRGAGIYNIGSVDLYGTARIKDNETDTEGVYNVGTMIHWDHGVRVMGNHARGRGGGIYSTDATNLQALVQMQVVNNTDDDPSTPNGNVYNAP